MGQGIKSISGGLVFLEGVVNFNDIGTGFGIGKLSAEGEVNLIGGEGLDGWGDGLEGGGAGEGAGDIARAGIVSGDGAPEAGHRIRNILKVAVEEEVEVGGSEACIIGGVVEIIGTDHAILIIEEAVGIAGTGSGDELHQAEGGDVAAGARVKGGFDLHDGEDEGEGYIQFVGIITGMRKGALAADFQMIGGHGEGEGDLVFMVVTLLAGSAEALEEFLSDGGGVGGVEAKSVDEDLVLKKRLGGWLAVSLLGTGRGVGQQENLAWGDGILGINFIKAGELADREVELATDFPEGIAFFDGIGRGRGGLGVGLTAKAFEGIGGTGEEELLEGCGDAGFFLLIGE